MSKFVKLENVVYFDKSYDFDKEDLIKISEIMKRRVGGDISASISAGPLGNLTGADVELLLNDASLETTKITEINFRVYFQQSEKVDYMAFNLKPKFMLGPVRLSITGEKDASAQALNEIGHIVEAKARWFWPLNYKGSVFVLLIYAVLAFIAGFFETAFVLSGLKMLSMQNEYPNLIGAAVTFNIFGVAGLIFVFRDYFFPSLTIRIGASKRSAENRDQLRKFLFSTLCVGMILSFFNRFAWDYLKGSN